MQSVTQPNADQAMWESLKKAIANSSGFQCWQEEQDKTQPPSSLDERVRNYLKETLETLAY